PIWLITYRLPRQHAWITPGELRHIETEPDGNYDVPSPRLPLAEILRYRQAWSFPLAKAMTAPVWWFYVFWLPKYLIEARHVSVHSLQLFGYVPFLAAIPASLAGGLLSGHLLLIGRSVNFARKVSLLVFALFMPLASLAVFSSKPWM